MFFQGYSTPNFDRVITLFKDFFRPHFISGLHLLQFRWIALKLSGQLDDKVVQCILF